MTFLCEYKNFFGAAGTGVHAYKILGYSIVDTSLTVVLAVIISKVFKIKFIGTFISLLLLSVFFHLIFCVDSTLTRNFTSLFV